LAPNPEYDFASNNQRPACRRDAPPDGHDTEEPTAGDTTEPAAAPVAVDAPLDPCLRAEVGEKLEVVEQRPGPFSKMNAASPLIRDPASLLPSFGAPQLIGVPLLPFSICAFYFSQRLDF